jgi:hypothetical protein
MADDLGVQIRDKIGVDNIRWGNDFPHSESTWLQSKQFINRIFTGALPP